MTFIVSRWRMLAAIYALVFLSVTLATGSLHDYQAYIRIWSRMLDGGEPWLTNLVDLNDNTYGPLFTAFAPLLAISPMAPKVLFALAWLGGQWLVVRRLLTEPAHRPALWIAIIALNPFPWVWIAGYGNNDAVVAFLLAVAVCGPLSASKRIGVGVALAALLKYYPLLLLPFMCVDRGAIRLRPLLIGLAVFLVGMLMAFAIWGPIALAPILVAESRGPKLLSVYAFLQDSTFLPAMGLRQRLRPEAALDTVRVDGTGRDNFSCLVTAIVVQWNDLRLFYCPALLSGRTLPVLFASRPHLPGLCGLSDRASPKFPRGSPDRVHDRTRARICVDPGCGLLAAWRLLERTVASRPAELRTAGFRAQRRGGRSVRANGHQAPPQRYARFTMRRDWCDRDWRCRRGATLLKWLLEQGSNLQALRHLINNQARLPIPPSRNEVACPAGARVARRRRLVERAGIEPASSACKAVALPVELSSHFSIARLRGCFGGQPSRVGDWLAGRSRKREGWCLGLVSSQPLRIFSAVLSPD